ncbi:MAG: MarR family transcriptional regulator [Pseudomonadota bacterium]
MSAIYAMPGHLIRRLQQISASVFAERMKAAGVDLTSPQFAALSVLGEHDGIDQATLAGMIAHDRPTIGGVVDRLAAKGLVERRTNPKDRRARRLSLTPAGQGLLARLAPVVAEIQTAILPGLSEQERQEFVRLAAKVAEAGNDLSRAPLALPGRKARAEI